MIGGMLKGLGGSMLKGLGKSIGWGLVVNLGVSLLASTAQKLLSRPKKTTPRYVVSGHVGDTDPTTTLPVVYGKHRIGGTVIYAGTSATLTAELPNGSGDPSGFLWLVVALAHGPVIGIDEVYLDGHQAFDANGRGLTNALPELDFRGHVAVWKAHGGAGQLAVEPMARGNKTVTGSSGVAADRRRITTSTAHGFVVGDVVDLTTVVACTAGYGYVVMAVGSSTQFDVFQVKAGTASGGGGTADHYTPYLPTVFPTEWTGNHSGKGVAFIVLRLYKRGALFGAIPKVEAVVRGRPARDPRAYTVKSATVTANGGGYTGYSSTVDLTITAHGYAEGDVVHVTGHTQPAHNGQHRILRVVDANTIRLPRNYEGTGTASVELLTYSTNPAVCIRDYLTNGIYGAGVTAAELNDTALGTEADHYDGLVWVPVANSASYTNRRAITQIVTDGATATVTTTTDHQYTTADTVRITGFDASAGGALNVASAAITVTGAATFTFASAVAAATYTPDTWDIPTGVEGEAPVPQAQGWVSAVTQTQKRYELSGVVDTRQPLIRVLEELLTACLGSLVYEAGTFRIFTRKTTSASAFALADDTVVGDWPVVLPGQRELANIVRVTFQNADRQYAPDFVEYPIPGDPNPYLTSTDNGIVLRKELELPFTTNRARAQQMAMMLRRETRSGIACTVTAKEEGLKLAVWDVVPVTRSACGWTAKGFWVVSMELLPDALVRLTLLEYDAACYALDAGDDSPFEVAAAGARVTSLAQGGLRGWSALSSLNRLKDQRRLPLLAAAGPRSYQHDGSGTYLPGILTSAGTLITITAHVVREGTDEDDVVLDLSYGGGSCTEAATGLNYVYTDDPVHEGLAAPTYIATTNVIDLAAHAGRYFVGLITTTAGAGTGAGGGGGGSAGPLV